MRDVDIVKKYQLQYLEKWAEGSAEDREKVRSILFSETACWFLDFVRRGLPFIDHEEMAQLIESVLKYPTFMQTREYYLNESQSDWLAHELMRKADPELYIKEAEKLSENEPVKEKIKQVIRKYI